MIGGIIFGKKDHSQEMHFWMGLPLTSVINSVSAGSIVSPSRMIAAAAVVMVVVVGELHGVQKRHQVGRRQSDVDLPRTLKDPVDRICPATAWVGCCYVFVTLENEGSVVISKQGEWAHRMIDTFVDAGREAVESRGGPRLGYPLTATRSVTV